MALPVRGSRARDCRAAAAGRQAQSGAGRAGSGLTAREGSGMLPGARHGIAPFRHAQLGEELAEVVAHAVYAEPEGGRELLVPVPRQLVEDRPLALAQQRVPAIVGAHHRLEKRLRRLPATRGVVEHVSLHQRRRGRPFAQQRPGVGRLVEQPQVLRQTAQVSRTFPGRRDGWWSRRVGLWRPTPGLWQDICNVTKYPSRRWSPEASAMPRARAKANSPPPPKLRI